MRGFGVQPALETGDVPCPLTPARAPSRARLAGSADVFQALQWSCLMYSKQMETK